MPGKKPTSFFDALVAEGVVPKKVSRAVLRVSEQQGRSPVEIVLEQGIATVESVKGVAQALGVLAPPVTASSVDWGVLERFDRQEAARVPFAPLVGSGQRIPVATVDPFSTQLSEKLSELLGQPVELLFDDPRGIRDVLEQGPGATQVGAAGEGGFEDFVADEGNLRVVEELRHFVRTESEWRRPVLLVGAGCVGKTSLLQAAHRALLTAFPNRRIQFVSCKGASEDDDLFPLAKGLDGLIVDDLDALEGSSRLEELFMQAFDAAYQRGGPIIISLSKPPATAEGLSTRVRATLKICRQLVLPPLREPSLEAIGRKAAAKAGLDPDAIDWPLLLKESRLDLRRILQAIEAGKGMRASMAVRQQEPPPPPPPESKPSDLFREEAEAIIAEAKAAVEEAERSLGPEAVQRAKGILAKALQAMRAGDYETSERLGMEALEAAALAHSRMGVGVGAATTAGEEATTASAPAPAGVEEGEEALAAALRQAERAVREACDAGAEEYASRELRVAVQSLEEARRLAGDASQITRALEEARLAAEQAADAARRARTRKEEARLKQEKEKVRRCQMAIEEVRKEYDRLRLSEEGTPIVAQLDEVEVLIDGAVQYQEVGNIGQALEQVMKARKRLGEIAEEARLRRELRDTINEVDALVREADRTVDVQNAQQLADIQNALAEAERVLMGDSSDYELGLNWARVARQKALRLVQMGGEKRPREAPRPRKTEGRELTFDTLEVSEANQFVVAMGRTAAETPHLVKSPLYVWGDVGVGKTHLLSAIYDLAKRTHPDHSVILTTAADFGETYREALSLGKASSFRETYRGADLLIVDDLHHLLGNSDGLREFFHTLSAIEAAGGLVVISASVPPRKLGIEDRSFRSRLEGGVVAEMKYPAVEARERILRREAKRYDVRIPDEALSLLASMISTNVRDLLGALGKLAAHARASGGQVTTDIMRRVLQEVLAGEEERWPRS